MRSTKPDYSSVTFRASGSTALRTLLGQSVGRSTSVRYRYARTVLHAVDVGATTTRLIALTDPKASGSANALRLSHADFEQVRNREKWHISPQSLRSGDTTIHLARTWDSRIRPAALPSPATATAFAHALGDPDLPGYDAAALIGRGAGLTPTGDDLICGYLAAAHAWGDPTRAAAEALHESGRTTDLSAEFIQLAADGEASAELRALVVGLARAAWTSPLQRLLQVGHTSGHDLARGVLLFLSTTISIRHSLSI